MTSDCNSLIYKVKWESTYFSFFGGPFFANYHTTLIQKVVPGEKVTLSLILLGLLRASASLWGITLYRCPGRAAC